MKVHADLLDKNFLVCDDYESMHILLGDHLNQLGIKNLTFATSGNDGFEKIKASLKTSSPIQFVITDLIMENGTGIELTKLIVADPATKHLPILMITSKADVSYVLESIKAGVTNYIVKPWQIEDLGKKIVESAQKKGLAGK